MFDGDIAVSVPLLERFGTIQQGVKTFTQVNGFRRRLQRRLLTEMGFQVALKSGWRHTGFFENATGQSVLFEECQHQMLGLQLLMASLLGQVLGREDRGPGLFSELFGRGLHDSVRTGTTV